MRGHAGAETTSFGKGGSRGAWRRKAARLEDTAKFLREALSPASRYRRIVVNEDIGAIVDGRTFENGFHQHERFTILVARRIGELIIGAGELPIQEPEEGSPVRLFIRDHARRKKRSNGLRIRPIFNCNAVARIVPGWESGQRRFALRRKRNRKPFEHRRRQFRISGYSLHKCLSCSICAWRKESALDQSCRCKISDSSLALRYSPHISISVPNSTTCPVGTPKKDAALLALCCRNANRVSRHSAMPTTSSLGIIVSRPT